jgi:CRP-like cAMP-binding protein
MGQIAVGLSSFPGNIRTTTRDSWDSGRPRNPSINIEVAASMRRRAEVVQRLQAFADIPMADCIAIVSGAQERHYARSFTIFAGHDALDHVLLLVSGCLKLTERGPNDHEIILRLNGPGELAGGILGQGRNSLSARAVQPSSALIWKTSTFQDALDRFPVLRRNVSRGLELQLDDLDTRFREISTEKVASRLCSLLVRLAKQVGTKADGHTHIYLSRQELAQLTGTTLFTVSRLLCRWETQGIVSAPREAVLIRDLPALQELSQQE